MTLLSYDSAVSAMSLSPNLVVPILYSANLGEFAAICMNILKCESVALTKMFDEKNQIGKISRNCPDNRVNLQYPGTLSEEVDRFPGDS